MKPPISPNDPSPIRAAFVEITTNVGDEVMLERFGVTDTKKKKKAKIGETGWPEGHDGTGQGGEYSEVGELGR